jgi:hypothetical protein
MQALESGMQPIGRRAVCAHNSLGRGILGLEAQKAPSAAADRRDQKSRFGSDADPCDRIGAGAWAPHLKRKLIVYPTPGRSHGVIRANPALDKILLRSGSDTRADRETRREYEAENCPKCSLTIRRMYLALLEYAPNMVAKIGQTGPHDVPGRCLKRAVAAAPRAGRSCHAVGTCFRQIEVQLGDGNCPWGLLVCFPSAGDGDHGRTTPAVVVG